jgi:hypothetical protein
MRNGRLVAPLLPSGGHMEAGFVGWLGQPVENRDHGGPVLLIARSFSHCVQFTERFYEVYHHVRDKRKAAEISMGVMMAPGTLGIVTDAAGLFLIAIAPIPAMERFALFCGFCALMLIPTNVFMSALLLTFLPEPRNVAAIIGEDEKHCRCTPDQAPARGDRLAMAQGRCRRSRAGWRHWRGAPARSESAIGGGQQPTFEDSEYNVAVEHINASFPA